MVQMYAAIKGEVASGGRAFVVCPLVDESTVPDGKEIKAATAEQERLQTSGGRTKNANLVHIVSAPAAHFAFCRVRVDICNCPRLARTCTFVLKSDT